MTTTGIPLGLCQCGCGQPTRVARYSDTQKGWVKGQPIRYIVTHQGRVGDALDEWSIAYRNGIIDARHARPRRTINDPRLSDAYGLGYDHTSAGMPR